MRLVYLQFAESKEAPVQAIHYTNKAGREMALWVMRDGRTARYWLAANGTFGRGKNTLGTFTIPRGF